MLYTCFIYSSFALGFAHSIYELFWVEFNVKRIVGMCFIYVACICNLGNFGPCRFKSISVRKFGEKKKLYYQTTKSITTGKKEFVNELFIHLHCLIN